MKRNQRGSVEDIFGILLVLVIMAVIFGGIAWVDYEKCGRRAKGLGLPKTWGMIEGCLVQVGSRWAPIEYIRIVDDKVIISGDGEG